jgi:23S rRNA (adenine1618-N6)-methyltransferase
MPYQIHNSYSLFPSIDFTMCNPPFYASKEDLISSASSKKRPPFTACTGSETEMVCDGGEVAFVSRMLRDSLILRERVQWYTSMLGKFSSVAQIIEQLKHEGIDNYAVTEFVQGNRTRRWAVGWSFGDLRPSMAASRGCGSLQKSLLPVPVEQTIDVRLFTRRFCSC